MSLEPGPLLAGKIAVVTGGGEVMGRGIAEAFGAHGATVVIADCDSDLLGRTADGIASHGGKVIPVLADVTRRADVRRVAELAGEVDILVNNIGPPVLGAPRFLESNEGDWDALYETNLKPVLLCCRAMVPGMIVRGRGGSVINVSVADGRSGTAQQAVYAAFGGAVTRFTRSLASELGPHRIRVNAVQVPAGRRAQQDDLAGAALFLASDLSEFVTGTAIRTDGKAESE
jgi:NAD(P)-dependent dehydrogenase (short-subunit alcohol dehydrogenase family)